MKEKKNSNTVNIGWESNRTELALKFAEYGFSPKLTDRIVGWSDDHAGTTAWLMKDSKKKFEKIPKGIKQRQKFIHHWHDKLTSKKEKTLKSHPIFTDKRWSDDREDIRLRTILALNHVASPPKFPPKEKKKKK